MTMIKKSDETIDGHHFECFSVQVETITSKGGFNRRSGHLRWHFRLDGKAVTKAYWWAVHNALRPPLAASRAAP